MRKFTIIVLDSLGVGHLPDADRFGDVGANTLLHVKKATNMQLPNMERLGLYNIQGCGPSSISEPIGCYGKCIEQAAAKDTTNGHFEIAGLILDKPFRVFGDSFPPRIIDALEKGIGRKVIGNYPASGTEIIQTLGDKHVTTAQPIVYLSADSLMQIAMHESVIPLEEQYRICAFARELMRGGDTVARIICRPFIGSSGNYTRTENRRDFSIDPPGPTVLDALKERGKDVIAVGKIEDIFNRRGITQVNHTKNNQEGIDATIEYLKQDFDGLLFVNLVDFDMLYGHRNDPQGYAKALEYFDGKLPEIMALMGEDDVLILTADHGCDPTFPGTDHTREYTPLLVCGSKVKPSDLGVRNTFSDIAATVADYFGFTFSHGASFLKDMYT